MGDDGIMSESEGYRGKDSGFGFKEICLRQVQRIADLGSKEWRKGFYTYTHPNPNMSAEVKGYIGDSRKEYFNSINILHDLLLPKFDDDIEKESEKIQDKIEQVKTLEHEKMMEDLIKLHRLLYQELCLFLERLGWLESSSTEE